MNNMRLIDANKLFEKVGKITPRNKEHYESIGEFMDMITNSETIEIRPKQSQVDEDAYETATCSNCKAEITLEYPYDSFCPNCGVRVRMV